MAACNAPSFHIVLKTPKLQTKSSRKLFPLPFILFTLLLTIVTSSIILPSFQTQPSPSPFSPSDSLNIFFNQTQKQFLISQLKSQRVFPVDNKTDSTQQVQKKNNREGKRKSKPNEMK